MSTPKIDLKKQLKPLYSAAAGKLAIVDVPEMQFLMVDGRGNPNTAEAYREAVEALYSASYTAKFTIKNGPLAIDYAVMPLEGLWWTDNPADFSQDNKDIWKWTAMIVQPEWVTPEVFAAAKRQAAKKKSLPALSKLRLQSFAEGKVAQVLHVGPYAEEAPTIERLHRFIRDEGFELSGKHHEIYLSDPRRAAPEKLKTILRQPFA